MIQRLVAVLATIAGIITATPAGARTIVEHAGPSTALSGASTTPEAARQAYDAMTPAERVGQLFMAGVNSMHPSPATVAALRSHHVGNVILDRNSNLGAAATASIVTGLDTALVTRGAKPFVATDQEGGQVQRLTGPGFSTMPSALAQGALSTGVLQSRARGWAQELSAAGISLNLAPVADTVPSPHAHANQPIGRYDREYGHRPSGVASHVAAVVRGESEGGIAVTVKHFPGLGRATGNTDVARHVTDPTSRHDSYLAPFRAGVEAGAPFVMVSVARYPNIDGRPACFSPTVMKQMLRGDLGFTGVVISDSFHAKAVRSVAPGDAAIRYFTAGGTILLDTDRRSLYVMERALLARAEQSAAFAAIVKADVLKVLRAKERAGLLS